MSLNEVDENILYSISEGPKSFYDFTRREQIGSNSVVLSALDRLLKIDLICQGPEEARGKKPYLLTVDGFDVVLRDINRILNFNSFVRNYKQHFPLVFNYWEELKKHGLQEWVKCVLEIVMKYIDFIVRNELFTGFRSRYSHEEFVTDLYTQIYGPFLLIQNVKEMKVKIPIDNLKDFIKEIPEIKNFLTLNIQEYENSVISQLKNLECYKKKFLLD